MKKVIYAMLCALLLATSLLAAGCTSKDTLNVAMNPEFEPFESVVDGEYVGFDVDLINEIAKKLDMKVNIRNMEFESVIGAVQTGSCQVAISGLTITPSRAKNVEFSTPYYTGASQMIIVKKDDTVFTGTTKAELDEQLKDKKIGVCAGFTGVDYVNGDEDMGFAKIEGATATTFDNIALAITSLKNGSIDAIVMDDNTAKKAAATAENADVKVINVALSTEEYAIAMKKGDTDMKTKVDKALKELTDDGTVAKLMKKWEIE